MAVEVEKVVSQSDVPGEPGRDGRARLGVLGRLVDGLMSWISRLVLGIRTSLGRPPRVQIIAFDGYAAEERWVVRGRVVEDRGPGSGGEGHRLVQALAKLKRTEIPHARVRASFADRSWETTTDEQGFFRFDLPPAAGPALRGRWVRVALELVGSSLAARAPGRVCELLLVPRSATLGVLSDIDDTVVRSESGSKLSLARRVLLRDGEERSVVEGAPDLYRALRDGASGREDNPVFYHSSASWNTYEHVEDFLRENEVPRGPMFLRQYNAESLLSRSDVDAKGEAVREVLDAYPELPFLLIGDARGDDDDVRVYLDAVRRYGDRVLAVYLRRGEDPERTARAEAVVREIRRLGGEALLVDGSGEIAAHAARRGWIAGEPRRMAASGD